MCYMPVNEVQASARVSCAQRIISIACNVIDMIDQGLPGMVRRLPDDKTDTKTEAAAVNKFNPATARSKFQLPLLTLSWLLISTVSINMIQEQIQDTWQHHTCKVACSVHAHT